jgi:hypothetical protein
VQSWQALLGYAPDVIVIKMFNGCGKLESSFLGGGLILVWSAP